MFWAPQHAPHTHTLPSRKCGIPGHRGIHGMTVLSQKIYSVLPSIGLPVDNRIAPACIFSRPLQHVPPRWWVEMPENHASREAGTSPYVHTTYLSVFYGFNMFYTHCWVTQNCRIQTQFSCPYASGYLLPIDLPAWFPRFPRFPLFHQGKS